MFELEIGSASSNSDMASMLYMNRNTLVQVLAVLVAGPCPKITITSVTMHGAIHTLNHLQGTVFSTASAKCHSLLYDSTIKLLFERTTILSTTLYQQHTQNTLEWRPVVTGEHHSQFFQFQTVVVILIVICAQLHDHLYHHHHDHVHR